MASPSTAAASAQASDDQTAFKSSCKPSLPAKAQEQSPLMRLPVEIRAIILRQLLISGSVFECDSPYTRLKRKRWRKFDRPMSKGTRTSLPRRAKPKSVQQAPKQMDDYKTLRRHDLTPAILGVCQTLLQESWPIVYGENILAVVGSRVHIIGPRIR